MKPIEMYFSVQHVDRNIGSEEYDTVLLMRDGGLHGHLQFRADSASGYGQYEKDQEFVVTIRPVESS